MTYRTERIFMELYVLRYHGSFGYAKAVVLLKRLLHLIFILIDIYIICVLHYKSNRTENSMEVFQFFIYLHAELNSQ
jgi:hypothetical protein